MNLEVLCHAHHVEATREQYAAGLIVRKKRSEEEE